MLKTCKLFRFVSNNTSDRAVDVVGAILNSDTMIVVGVVVIATNIVGVVVGVATTTTTIDTTTITYKYTPY